MPPREGTNTIPLGVIAASELSIVTGARRELHRRQAEIGGGAREGGADALGGRRGRVASDGLDRHVEPVSLGRRLRERGERALERVELRAHRASGTRAEASRVPARR